MFVTVWYEPTDTEKACKPFLSNAWKSLSYSSPNLAELFVMNKTMGLTVPKGNLRSFSSLRIVDVPPRFLHLVILQKANNLIAHS